MTLELNIASLASALLVFVAAMAALSSGRTITRIEKLTALAELLPKNQKDLVLGVRDDLVDRLVRTHRHGRATAWQMVVYAAVGVVVIGGIVFVVIPEPDSGWPIETVNVVVAVYFGAMIVGLVNSAVLYIRDRSQRGTRGRGRATDSAAPSTAASPVVEPQPQAEGAVDEEAGEQQSAGSAS